MAFAEQTYLGDGVQTEWSINFSGGYISSEHVKATLISPEGVESDQAFSFVGPFLLSITPAVADGWSIKFYRDTPKELPLVDYTDGAIVNEANLDKQSKQAIFSVAEMVDQFVEVELLVGTAAQDAADSALAALAAEEAAEASAASAANSAAIATSAEILATDAAEHASTTGNPHGTTKGDVGLGSVDNTSDADKPVSILVQAALDLKATTSVVQSEFDVRPPTVPNYAAVRSYSGGLTSLTVAGYSAPGDGAGVFHLDVLDVSSTDNDGTILVDALSRRWKRAFVGPMNVKWFGATGDGVTSDTAPIQAAINAQSLAGGGVVEVPKGSYVCNVVLAANTTLCAEGTPTFGYLASGARPGVVLLQESAGFVVDTPVASTVACSVVGINFQGAGSLVAGGGVHFRNVTWGVVKNCSFNNFADQAILKDAGVACVFEDILITNSLMNRTRSVVNGVIEVTGGADDYLHRVQANPGLSGGVSSPDLRVCGIVIKTPAANAFVSTCVGEFSDYGIYTTASLGRFMNCRADLNQGGGFFCGGSAQYANCLALSNGQAAANTYDGFAISSQGGNFANCRVSQLSSTVRYGFSDSINVGAVSSRNNYVNCNATGYGTAAFSMVGFLGSSPIEPGTPLRDATATPDTTGTTFVVCIHSSPTTITDFLGGYSGKTIRLLAFNTNVTVANNATIGTNTGANKTLAASKIYSFTHYSGKWYEAE